MKRIDTDSDFSTPPGEEPGGLDRHPIARTDCATCGKPIRENDLVLNKLDAGLIHVRCRRGGDMFVGGPEPFPFRAEDFPGADQEQR